MWNERLFLRMVGWARNPPSLKRVILVFAILLGALTLVGIEKFIGWPDVFTMERAPKKIKLSPISQ